MFVPISTGLRSICILLVLVSIDAFSATLVVTSNSDDVSVDGSFRNILTKAHDGDVIRFQSNLTIQLVSSIDIDKQLQIVGPTTFIPTSGQRQKLNLTSDHVTLKSLTFTETEIFIVGSFCSLLANTFASSNSLSGANALVTLDSDPPHNRFCTNTTIGTKAEPNAFTSHKQDFIDGLYADNTSISFNTFSTDAAAKIYIANSTGLSVSDNTFNSGTTFQSQTVAGIIDNNTWPSTNSIAILCFNGASTSTVCTISNNRIHLNYNPPVDEHKIVSAISTSGSDYVISRNSIFGSGSRYELGISSSSMDVTSPNSHLTISNNYVSRCFSGISVANSGTIENSNISSNTVELFRRRGLSITNSAASKSTLVSSNVIKSGTGYADACCIEFTGIGDNVSFSDNQARNSDANGLEIFLLSGNLHSTRDKMYGLTGHGVINENSSGVVTLLEDQILDCKGNGFLCTPSSVSHVNSCVIQNNKGAGVYVDVDALCDVSQGAFGGNLGPGIDIAPHGVSSNGVVKKANRNMPYPDHIEWDQSIGMLVGKSTPGSTVQGFVCEGLPRIGNPRNGEGYQYVESVVADGSGTFTFPSKKTTKEVALNFTFLASYNGATSEFSEPPGEREEHWTCPQPPGDPVTAVCVFRDTTSPTVISYLCENSCLEYLGANDYFEYLNDINNYTFGYSDYGRYFQSMDCASYYNLQSCIGTTVHRDSPRILSTPVDEHSFASLLLVNNGDIYMSVNNRSSMKNNVHTKVLHIDNYPQYSYVHALAVTNRVSVFFDNYALRYNPTQKLWEYDTAGLGKANIRGVFKDALNTLYVSTNAGLFKRDSSASRYSLVPVATQTSNYAFCATKKAMYTSCSKTFYSSTNNGSSWIIDTLGLEGRTIMKITVDANENVYGLTQEIGRQERSRLYLKKKGELAWKRIDEKLAERVVEPSFTNYITDIASDTVLFVASRCGLFVSSDYGASWRTLDNVIDAHAVFGLARTSSGKYFQSTAVGIFRGNSASNVWEQVYPQSLPQVVYGRPLYHDEKGNLYSRGIGSTISSSQAQPVMMSSDEGRSWQVDTTVDKTLKSAPHIFYVDNNGNQYLGTYSNGPSVPVRIYLKKYGTTQWTLDTIGFQPRANNVPQSFSYDRLGNTYFVTQDNGSSVIWKKAAASSSWTTDTLGLNKCVVFTVVSDKNGVLYASTFGRGVYAKSPGSLWKQLPTPANLQSGYSTFSVSCDSNNIVWAAFNQFDGGYNSLGRGVFFSSDAGATWVDAGFDSVLVNTLYSYGDTTFLRTSNGLFLVSYKKFQISVGVENEYVTTVDADVQVYPNPATNSIVVDLSIPEPRDVRIQVVDVNSNIEIDELRSNLSPGQHRNSYDISHLPAGAYVCRIMIANHQHIIPFIVLR